MAPMPSIKSQKSSSSFLFPAVDSGDSSPTPSSPPSTDVPKSQCSSLSEGESFEGYGENEGNGSTITNDSTAGVELDLAPHGNSTTCGDEDRNATPRDWARMSLRRTPTSSGRRQLSSNALASHLYRSSSFNSSGRSSNCDTTEDMYSDVSLEDVQDLSHKSKGTQPSTQDTQSKMNSQPTSQPESIDLAYDMWAGQFEFIGSPQNNTPNNNNALNNNNYLQYKFSDKNSSQNRSTDSLEDLNLNFNTPWTETSDSSKQPILIDQETFLSLNPTDFDDVASSGPNSLVFIENKFNESQIGTDNGNKLINLEALTNKLNCKPNNNNTNGFKLENLKNFKNKLLSDFSDKYVGVGGVGTMSSGGLQPHSVGGSSVVVNGGVGTKLHGISAELCENLNEQLELLQRQVTDLADTQNVAEDRSTRTKTEYAVLQARYHMLEEQYRESELRAEERLAEEQKRHRELLARVEREAALQNENCQIKIRTIEIEANALRDEAQRLRVLCDKQASDLHNTEEKLELARDSILSIQQDLNEAKLRERKLEQEKKVSEDLMVELSSELERLRSEVGPIMSSTPPETIRLEELHQELEILRQKNKTLEEQNEELQATVLTRGVEEGRHLLNGTLNSLAQELEEMSQAQESVDSATLASLSQLQQAFQEKEDENTRLKHYIDTILLNIVENYPQLLEVKPVNRAVQN